jgi:hypothetical protein
MMQEHNIQISSPAMRGFALRLPLSPAPEPSMCWGGIQESLLFPHLIVLAESTLECCVHVL